MRNRNLASQAIQSASGIVLATLAIMLHGSLSLMLLGVSVISFIAALGVACPDYSGGRRDTGNGL